MKHTVLICGLTAFMGLSSATFAQDLRETDLAALRYFLSINDEASVQAEIQRLETEFPGANIRETLDLMDAQASQVDTSPIWRRIEADDYAGARELIAEFEEDNAGWTAPADMIEILDAKQGQAAFEAAYADGDLNGVIRSLSEFPTILTCERVNNPWRLAELQVAAELPDEALATYEGVLQGCHEEDYVVATLQKASEISEKEQLEDLFDTARRSTPALTGRLAKLEEELFPQAEPVEEVAAAPAPVKKSSGSSSGGGGGSSPQLTRAAAAADRGDWAQCLQMTTGTRSINGINQRAWCTLNYGRPREAIQGFQHVASNSGSASMRRDATYGMILAYSKTGQLEQAAALANKVSLTASQRSVVNSTVISKLAARSYERGRYRETLQYLDRLSRESGSLDRGNSLLRGWALLKSGNKTAARAQFRRVHQTSPGNDSLQGIIEAR